jgi:hypothetical protein
MSPKRIDTAWASGEVAQQLASWLIGVLRRGDKHDLSSFRFFMWER